MSSSSPNIESSMSDSKRSRMDPSDATDGPPYAMPMSNNTDNSFDSLFQKAQYENLTQHMPLYSAASDVMSMEEDEFDSDNENLTIMDLL